MTASLVQLAGVLLIFTAGGAVVSNLLPLSALKWASRVPPLDPSAAREASPK
jgi:hypothetical protein